VSNAEAGEQSSGNPRRRPMNRAGGLHRSRSRIVAAADADRRALERALHDGLQQQLIALAMYLQRARGLADSDPPAARAVLDEATTLVRQAIDDAARLAQRIYPPLLEARGLAPALRAVADEAGVTLSVDIGTAGAFPAQVTAALYWSCAEVLSTAQRGTNVAVTVRRVGEAVEFELARQGDYAAELVERLRDRIEALGGAVDVAPAGGTARLAGWLPLAGE
jgi:signal transduction histidine kinase